MNKILRNLLIALGVLLAVGAGVGAYVWYVLRVKPVTAETHWLYIVGDSVSNPELLAADEIQWAMKLTEYDERLHQGKLEGAYKLVGGMTATQVARKLALHQQDPVRVTFNNARLKEQVAGKMARTLMADSVAILKAMLDPAFLAEAKVDAANVASIFLPDTYEVYWNIKPEELMQRMLREYNRFWNEKRQQQAKALNLSPREVSILASIAEEETTNRQERGTVARLYWNRLQQGMLLQADPTIKFALGDFALKRILLRHLTVDSPYNTYRYAGLPPGPIRVVEKATIDTILNSRPNNYLYMCAKPDFSGRHNFATSLAEHLRNADAYHQALNARK
ncbi:MAG: endolytic transglycosylase MltG [Bacteroidales bacterium]|nr:endolytic transglycosylase MltG [Bacteroidales bacterium]